MKKNTYKYSFFLLFWVINLALHAQIKQAENFGDINNLSKSANRKIIQGEFYWDTDPGAGNGTAIIASDGTFDESFEDAFLTSISTSSLSNGPHKISVRYKDFDNNWGPVFSNVVFVSCSNAPSAAGAIFGTDSLCSGINSFTYSTATLANATSYIWTYTGTGAIINGNGNIVTIDFDSTATSGILTVMGHNNSCDGPASIGFPITITEAPSAPTAGSNSPVYLDSTLYLTASAITDATYSWTGPDGFTSNEQNPIVSSATLAMSGTYYVEASINGCTGPIDSTIVTIISVTPDSACGLQEFFDGITAPSAWAFNSIGAIYTSSGNYGISSPALKFDATGDAIETAPVSNASQLSFWFKGVLTDAVSSLLIEGYDGASWVTIDNISSLPIVGTTQTYNNVNIYSYFKFTYVKSVGNLAFDDVNIICGTTGISTNIQNDVFSVYPNPGTGIYTVECTGLNQEKVNIKVFDCIGQLIICKPIFPNENKFKTTLDISDFANGIYTVKVEYDNANILKQIVKQ